ncbi:MAG: transglutaminase-like cysteine peptidase [Methyloceanibacter sp.]
MKHFLLGSAFVMFISSLPADATNTQTISLKPAPAHAPQKVVFMEAFGESLPPIGFVTFCRENKGACRSSKRYADRVQFSPAKLRELEQVNNAVNAAVAPVTDLELHGKVEVWSYPVKGKGDCEDYVLLKRHILIERGWPESTLLITVVRDENNEGHAVLTVRTDDGDYVLDNKRAEIMHWTDTPYTFVKRQSARNPLVWISLLPPELVPQASISASNR